MTIGQRLATGTMLLILLLLAVLTYHLAVVGRLIAANRELSTQEVRSIVVAIEQIRQLELMEDAVRKLAATGDGRYADRVEQIGRAFDKRLTLAASLERSPAQQRLLERLDAGWASFVRGMPSPESLAASPRPEARRHLLQESLVLLTALRGDVQLLVGTAHGEMIRKVDRSERERRRSERVAAAVFAAALLLGLVTLTVTIRSIQRSLRRLTEATLAVSEENFFHQVETPRGDEFARLAGAFNHMVRRLGELDAMKRNLLSEVSHELKTPLANIVESHRLLLDGLPGPLNPDQRRLLDLALGSCRKLSRMISNMLERERFSAGAVELRLEEAELGPVVSEVLGEFGALVSARGILLETRFPASGSAVRCDRERIAQVFRNLIDNALKSSPRGSRIVLRSERVSEPPADLPERWRGSLPAAAGYLLAEVVDEGVGVLPEDRELIFRRFHRAATRQATTAGVGLGLAICREVIQAHRGAIWVTPNQPVGSRFRFLLPVAEPADAAAHEMPDTPARAVG